MATSSSKGSSYTKRLIMVIVGLAIIAGATALHFRRLHQADNSPTVEAAPWAVETGSVELGSVAGSIQAEALIEAAENIVLSPQIQGTVLAVGPRAGTAVHRGELLLRIDARTISRNVSALAQQRTAAQADAEFAGRQQQRMDELLAEGGVSQAQADQARAAAAAAHARVNALGDQIGALRAQLGYAEIRAPQDAIVAERLVEVGNTVGPGRPVYRLTAGHGAVVKVGLAAEQLANVQVGDSLELRQGDDHLSLTVSRVAPAVNRAGLGMVEADADAAPFGLPSGSTVMAIVHATASDHRLTVPMAALVGSGSAAHVVVFTPSAEANEPGRLTRVPVEIAQEGTTRAAVRGELSPDQRVVVGQTAVLAQLADGDPAVTSDSAVTSDAGAER